MRYKITAPLKNFTGLSVGVAFQAGVAEVDDSNDGGRSALAYFRRAGYQVEEIPDAPADSSEAQAIDDELFDPSGHGVDDVLTYLAGASREEAVRVLDAEAAGKNRVTITGKHEEILATKEQEATA